MTNIEGLSHIVDVQEDKNAVTVIVDDPEKEHAEVHSIDASEPGAAQRLYELNKRSSNAVVLSYFGLRLISEESD